MDDDSELVKPYNILEVKLALPVLVKNEPLSTSIVISSILVGLSSEPVTTKYKRLLPWAPVTFSPFSPKGSWWTEAPFIKANQWESGEGPNLLPVNEDVYEVTNLSWLS